MASRGLASVSQETRQRVASLGGRARSRGRKGGIRSNKKSQENQNQSWLSELQDQKEED